MFSQASVKNSVHGGGVPPWADTPRADCSPLKTATTADGTHPTGMHSCFRDDIFPKDLQLDRPIQTNARLYA